MPEIKKHFTGGKMNKDVDERLVPNGEYRHALNVQVSTSEGSDVGTIENLLGNSQVLVSFSLVDFVCVGSISDEKSDSSYWFLKGPDLNYLPVSYGTYGRNYIIRQKREEVDIIFTDTKEIFTQAEVPGVGNSAGVTVALDYGNNIIYMPAGFSSELSVGDILEYIYDPVADIRSRQNTTIISISPNAGPGGPEFIVVANLNPQLQPVPSSGNYYLYFKSNCLNFQENSIITGINIVDDLLFWTDNHNEPKMLNIERSREGTDQDGLLHTKLINPQLPSVSSFKKVEPHHIQVIKRKPTHALATIPVDLRREGLVYGQSISYKFSNITAIPYTSGYEDTLHALSSLTGQYLNYEQGDVILLLNTADQNDPTAARSLPHQYDLKILITGINHHSGNHSDIDFKIISISALAPIMLTDYTSLLLQSGSTLFDEEMARFSYRYKYTDGEVSCFAPWSNPSFIAGEFKYDQRNAYNYGMLNNISGLTLTNFIDFPNTLNVDSIDLLVKNENSPSVYLIDTVRREQFNNIQADASGNPFGGTYEFNPNQVKSTLPENQLLRPWDNVPRKALAQDVTGNRIIYGNYLESYNYPSNFIDVRPGITQRPLNLIQPSDGGWSIKTQRNYQVGMVLIDKEGRESPIITNETANVNVAKGLLDTNTMLSVSNYSTMPDWVNSYKYYVKDSSGPSYNMVIDAFYQSESGDTWVSVPSSERNKVKEGDLIELKKGINDHSALLTPLRTKIIAIENEAPDFIKIVYRKIGRSQCNYVDASGANAEIFMDDGRPRALQDWFKISKQQWMGNNVGFFGGGADLDGIDLAISFDASPAATSPTGGLYKTKLLTGKASLNNYDPLISDDEIYMVRLDEAISEYDDWISDPASSTTITEPTLHISIYEKTTPASSEYAGKFFMKIEAKEDLVDNIAPENVLLQSETIVGEVEVYNFCDGDVAAVLGSPGDKTTDVSVEGQTGYPSYNVGGQGMTHTYEKWQDLLEWKFLYMTSTDQTPQYWFIDRMYFRRRQNPAHVDHPSPQGNDGYGLGVFKCTPSQATGGYPQTPQFNLDAAGNNKGFLVEGLWYMEISLVGMMKRMGFSTGTLLPIWEMGGVGGDDWGEDSVWDIRYRRNSFGYTDLTSPTATYSNHIQDITNQQTAFENIPHVGGKFKWQGGTKIWTITNATFDLRWNHTNVDTALDAYVDWWNGSTASSTYETLGGFVDPTNRRLTMIVELDGDPTSDVNIDPTNPNQVNTTDPAIMVFLSNEVDVGPGRPLLSTNNPAVFEVTSEDEEKLDLYYEASDEIPININYKTLQRLIPVGSKVNYPGDTSLLSNSQVTKIQEGSPSKIIVDGAAGGAAYFTWEDIVTNGDKLLFTTPAGNIIGVKLLEVQGGSSPQVALTVGGDTLDGNIDYGLGWSNCISFRNGVESVYLKDDYNEKYITKGVKVSSTLDKEFTEETRSSGLIYSGLYNSISDMNNLNQFISGEKITKDLNPTYGSIQKLHARDSDLIAFCEDKVLKVLANKDAVYNADGNAQLTATANVLGQTIPFYGEYGISKNPESFASEAYRAYFTDRIRGTVMRLSKDGLTPISMHGMKDWFKKNLKLSNRLMGSYDDKKDEYNISLQHMGVQTYTTVTTTTTIPFSWTGWSTVISHTLVVTPSGMDVQVGDTVVNLTPGFSYPQDTVIVAINDNGTSIEIVLSNDLMCDSSCDFSLQYSLELLITGDHSPITVTAETPDTIIWSDSKTLSFREDVKGWVSFKSYFPESANSCANEYYTFSGGGLWKHHVEFNLGGTPNPRNTFYNVPYPSSVSVVLNDYPSSMKSFKTLKYEGSQSKVNEFVEYSTFDPSGVNVTGTFSDREYYNLTPGGKPGWFVESIETNKQKGSIDEFLEKEGKWFNYIKGESVVSNDLGNITSGFDTANFAIQGIGMSMSSSIGTMMGCTCSGSAPNNCYGDGEPAFNFDPNATMDDGSCYPIICGCIDPNADNFIPLTGDNQIDINTDFCNNSVVSSCVYNGCTNPGAFNYNPNANSDDGSCIPIVLGCTDPTAYNFDPAANTDDESCEAIYIGCMDDYTTDGCGIGVDGACNFNPLANTDDPASCIYAVWGCMDDGNLTGVPYTSPYPGFAGGLYDIFATHDDGSCLYCGDVTADNFDNAVNAAGAPYYGACEWCVQTTNLHVINQTTTGVDLVWDTPTTNQPQAAGDYYLTITETTGGAIVFQGIITPIAGGAYQSYSTSTGIPIITLSAGTDYTFELGLQCSNSNGITDTYSTSTIDILGCTDDGAQWNSGNLNPALGEWGGCNYDPTATLDDGTCGYDCGGCTDPLYVGYCNTCYTHIWPPYSSNGPWLHHHQPDCGMLILGGCTDSTAMNYDPLATFDDGTCEPYIYGCTDDQLDNNGIYNNDPTSYAASNYNPLANTPCDLAGTSAGNNECCNYSCPILSQQQGFSTGTFGQNTVRLNVNLLNTFYSLGISGGGDPDDYKMYVSVEDASGTILYDNNGNELSGVTVNGTGYHLKKLAFIEMGVPVGQTEIFVDWLIETNDGQCDDDAPSATYTIGCTDATADNAGSYHFTDDTQCTYTGCTDDTLDNNGNYAATNFNPLATTSCGGDNSCCIYNNTPAAELLYAGSSSGTTNYSGFYAMRFDFDATALQSATITAISVETTGQSYTSWNSYYIGGASSYQGTASDSYIQHFAGTSNLTLGTGGTYDKDLLPLDFNNFDTATWVGLEHPTVNTLAHGIGNGDPVNLNIEYTVQWSGPIDNAYLGNQLSNTTTHSQTFTGGCKVGSAGMYTNWDSALQLHIPGSCIPLLGGCLDPTAQNYCSTCNADCNGTVGGTNQLCCIATVNGCMDSTAFNYDPAANVDDGSCCTTPCPVPGTLSVAQISGTFVSINYTDMACAEYYQVETLEPGGSWTVWPINITQSTQNSPGVYYMNISSFTSGIELQFRVNSVCVYDITGATANSAYTNTAMYITP